MKNLYLILIGLFATSCATVNSAIEGGKNIAMTTIDTTVKTAIQLLRISTSKLTNFKINQRNLNNGCFNTFRNCSNSSIAFC